MEEDATDSEEEDQLRKRAKFPKFNPETDMIDPKFEVGQVFTCKQLFMKACKSHGVVHGRKIKFSKNDGRRATAYCKDCSWKVSTAVMLDKKTFQIKSMQGEHSCERTFDHGLANSIFWLKGAGCYGWHKGEYTHR